MAIFAFMGNCINIDHAKHNENVCNYLSKKADFSDWIITTAFYSALHYVRCALLQCKHNDWDGNERSFSDFEDLYTTLRTNREGRHGFQIRLVETKLSSIKYQYQRLYELCQEARYFNYKYERTDSTNAKKYLDEIKAHCIK